MPKYPLFVAIVLLVAGAGAAFQAQSDRSERDLDSLIAAERAFSKLSETQGLKAAFLANLAPQGMVLQARPTLGRPVYEKIPPGYSAVLTWEPEVAEVSAAGDLGWTSGPYALRMARDEQDPAGRGHYVSVWGRGPGGDWKVLLDGGVKYPASTSEARPEIVRRLPAAGNAARLSPAERARERRALIKRDESFSSRVEAVGFAGAHLHEGTDDIRLCFEGEAPVLGTGEVRAKFADSPARVALAPLGSDVAVSGDLGYSYGTGSIKEFVANSPEMAFSYLRIWRRTAPDRWRLGLELLTIVPQVS